jgi:hypothetical protein
MRYLVIAARGHSDTYGYLQRQFAGDDAVQVLVDRRHTERRRQHTSYVPQRRRTGRRHSSNREGELATHGFLIVRQTIGSQWLPPWWGAETRETSSEFDRHRGPKDWARLIVSAIALAHKERIVEAIKRDNLFESLEKELEEGREYYEKNVDPSALLGADYFDQAIVDLLVRDQGRVASAIW